MGAAVTSDNTGEFTKITETFAREITALDKCTLMLAFVDEVLKNRKPIGGGNLELVNASDMRDLERARDLVRDELKRRA